MLTICWPFGKKAISIRETSVSNSWAARVSKGVTLRMNSSRRRDGILDWDSFCFISEIAHSFFLSKLKTCDLGSQVCKPIGSAL